jgi:hypothetical protein
MLNTMRFFLAMLFTMMWTLTFLVAPAVGAMVNQAIDPTGATVIALTIYLVAQILAIRSIIVVADMTRYEPVASTHTI